MMLYFTCSNCWRSWDGKPAVTARCVHHVLHPSADRRRSSVTSRGRRALPPVCRRCPPAGWSKQPLSVMYRLHFVVLAAPSTTVVPARSSRRRSCDATSSACSNKCDASTSSSPRSRPAFVSAKSCAPEVRTRPGSTRDARGTCSCCWFRRRPRPCSAVLVVPARRLDNRTVQPFRC